MTVLDETMRQAPTATPRVTALITAHNYGRFITETIESVLRQTVPAEELEILVVDNGSTDDTRKRVTAFGDRVRYEYQTDFQSQAWALNTGVRLARGRFVCLLDADDLWAPDKVAQVLSRFESEPDLGGVQHGCSYADGESRPLPGKMLPPPFARYELDDLLRGPIWNTPTSTLSFRRDVLKRIGPMPVSFRVLADAYLVWHCLFFAPVANLHEPLTAYRRHGSSWSDRWGAAKGEPRDLWLGRSTQAKFDASIKRRLRVAGKSLQWPAETRGKILRERLEQMALLCAHRKARARSLKLLLRYCAEPAPPLERLSKSAGMLFALLAPALYRKAFLFYRRNPALARFLGRVRRDDPFLHQEAHSS